MPRTKVKKSATRDGKIIKFQKKALAMDVKNEYEWRRTEGCKDSEDVWRMWCWVVWGMRLEERVRASLNTLFFGKERGSGFRRARTHAGALDPTVPTRSELPSGRM